MTFSKRAMGIFLTALIALSFSVSEAYAVKITLVNKTDLKISVALKWWADGSDNCGGTKGWYAVEPGESRVISWAKIDGAAVQVGYMGYYATAKGLVWKGKNEVCTGWIHPSNAFETTAPDQEIDGGKEVSFCMFNINLDKSRSYGVGTITFSR